MVSSHMAFPLDQLESEDTIASSPAALGSCTGQAWAQHGWHTQNTSLSPQQGPFMLRSPKVKGLESMTKSGCGLRSCVASLSSHKNVSLGCGECPSKRSWLPSKRGMQHSLFSQESSVCRLALAATEGRSL
jgi:hypothetical protein